MSSTAAKKKHRALKVLGIMGAFIFIVLIGAFAFLKMTLLRSFPELRGEPEVGKWYRVTPESAKSSDGSEWHGIFRRGSEKKAVVYFFGGGISITGETREWKSSEMIKASANGFMMLLTGMYRLLGLNCCMAVNRGLKTYLRLAEIMPVSGFKKRKRKLSDGYIFVIYYIYCVYWARHPGFPFWDGRA